MTAAEPCASPVRVYAMGLISLAACAPADMDGEQVAAALNAFAPTGISSQWRPGEEPFEGHDANPIPCNHEPEARRHWLMEC